MTTVPTTRLGRHGLIVGRLALGTMNFGWHTPRNDAFAMLDRALELGINLVDTADVYGWTDEPGTTERLIGDWFALGDGRREATVLATKVYNPMVVPGRRPEPNRDGRSLSAYKIRAGCDASLQRLRTDRIDLFQLHHVDRSCPWDEVWQAFDGLMAQGKVVYAGSSNLAGWDLASACLTAERRGTLGLVSEQSHYHLLERTVELEVLPAARHFGLGFLPWSPLGGGLLGGALGKTTRMRTDDPFLKKVAEVHPQLVAFEALCKELGEEPATIALAWLLHQPGVTAPVIGPRTFEHLNGAVRAATLELDDATLGRLDAIFPGTGGGAPEAYSW